MKFRLLIAFFILSTFLLAQSQLKYPSLLWKISGNGIKKEGYLYGTMHVSNRVAYHLSDQFFEALKYSEVVGLETNPADWLNNMELMGELGKASGVGIFNPYSGNFYKSVFGIRFPDKQVYKSILSFDPDIINGLLYRHNTSRENFQENTYIDLFIFQAAAKLNKQIVSLEDFKKAEIQAKLAALPDSEFEEEGAVNEDYNTYGRYSYFEKIEDAYRQGNLDVLDSLSKLSDSKNMQKYLLHERNVYFVNSIDSILKSGKSLFSGVGAAHLPGEKGVIEMLRMKGYKVEPIMPGKSKKSAKEKDKIDKITKPVVFEKNYVSDSLFSVDVPGKLTQIMNYDNIKYYINADMVNGNFYNIARIRTNAALNNLSAIKISQSVDSLFFENIPGKIISKKEINNSGISGYDIVNKTMRGDLQRYHIYFTDVELILFKLGGRNEFVNTSDGKRFFNSIKFKKENTANTTFEPQTKGFTVKVPAEYSYGKNDYVGATGLVEDLIAFDKLKETFYGVKHAVYNDFYYLEEDSFELNKLASYTLRNFKFENNQKFELRNEQKLPCIYFSGTNTLGKKMLGKVYIKGIHYYLVYSVGGNEISYSNDFYNSFTLTDFKHLNEIKLINDNDLFFSAMDEVSTSASGKFYDEYKKVYEEIKAGAKPKKANPYEYDYFTKSKNYYSPSNHEYVEIFYEKYNDYDYRTKEDLLKKVNKNLGEAQTMNVRTVQQKDSAGVFIYEFFLTDTATVRAIKVKIIVKNGTIYQVKAPIDTILGMKGWTKSFYESFELKDTVIGVSLFANKFKLLLEDMSSSDTTLRKRAEYSLANSISLEKEYVDEFVQFLKSDKFLKVSSDAKAQLFVSGGVFRSDKIVDVYKQMYDTYTDSAYLQICILKGLAYCKTKNAYDAFLELVKKETPLVGDEGIVKDVFNVLYDSLELCKNYFPNLLSVSRNNEYYQSIYRLLSVLMKGKIVPSSAILNSKAELLNEANSEFKRYNASLSSKAKSSNQKDSYNSGANEELIEQLQAYLETIDYNQSVKNTKYNDILVLNKQPFIVSFARILVPFYKSDEKVKQVIDKIAKIKSESILMPVHVLLLKNGIVINDTLTTYFSKNANTRAVFYSELKKENLEKYFDKKYATQQLIVESVLKTAKQVLSFTSYELPDKSKDSLIYHKEITAQNKYQKGTVYIYKSPKNKLGVARWSSAFVPAQKNNELSVDIEILKVAEYFNETKTDKEIENEILEDFNLQFRGRVIKNNYNDLFNYGGYN